MRTITAPVTSWLRILGLGLLLALPATLRANTLEDIEFTTLPGERVQIRLKLSEPAPEPSTFTIDNPARIALDLPNTQLGLKQRYKDIDVGVARRITAVEAGGRTRVVINLARLIGFETRVQGNDIILTLADKSARDSLTAVVAKGTSAPTLASADLNVLDIDFRRGLKGEGRILVTLADPNTPIDLKKRGKQLIVTLKHSKLPEKLERRLDVTDFATPVRTIDAFNHGNDVRLVVSSTSDFDHIAYQTNEKFTIDIKPIPKKEELVGKDKRKFPYTGERLSLNFQNIDVRAVLQLIADFTGLNMVVSDSVSGNLTLRLKNVPWDQALDIILKTKGLAKRQSGNVMLIAPAEEIAAQEKLELEAAKQVVELAPLVNETIQVNYAKAEELAKLIDTEEQGLLSARGSITVDQRTNKLLVTDTADHIDEIIALVKELDVPIRQVLIESRVVLAGTTFSKELGVKFGVSATRSGNNAITTSGSLSSADAFNQFSTTPQLDQRLNVNLPATAPTAASIGLAIARLPFGTMLDLELSAAQAEGKSETISSPRVITANQQEATIETGTEIPYQQAASSGATTVSFKKAVLSLKVTPQITPDERIIMDLEVTKDRPDFSREVLGVPPIDTNRVTSQVLVENGETIVLGGVYEQSKTRNINRVPFFGDLPLVGGLFRNRSEENSKSELLIFISPKLLKSETAL